MKQLLCFMPLVCTSACHGEASDVEPLASSAFGAWSARVIPTANDCGETLHLAPIRSGYLNIQSASDELFLKQPGNQLDLRYDGADWVSFSANSWGDCHADTETIWRFKAVGTTGFYATVQRSFRASDECEAPITDCSVTYSVQGMR